MKRSTIALVIALAVPTSMPVFAGPNWDVIHRAEAKKASHERESALVLPLDYGPRAVTTPWLNRQRLARLIAQADDQRKVAASHADHKDAVVAAHGHQNHGTHS